MNSELHHYKCFDKLLAPKSCICMFVCQGDTNSNEFTLFFKYIVIDEYFFKENTTNSRLSSFEWNSFSALMVSHIYL